MISHFIFKELKLLQGNQYLEVEAEESGDEASSDEYEGNDDHFDMSFVDDNTMATQATGAT